MTDRLTDAEKLENAIEQMADVLASFRRTELTRSANELRDVVARMRESRKPKPKWQAIGGFGIAGPERNDHIMLGSNAVRDRVLDLLNKADPA